MKLPRPVVLKTTSMSYNNITLISKKGTVASRNEIPIEGHRIVVSAMSSIVGENFIKAVAKLPKEMQPTIHLPRDNNSINKLKLAASLKLEHIFVGIGLNTPELEKLALKFNYPVLLDVANGYAPNVLAKCLQLKKDKHKVLCCGSVHTAEGLQMLLEHKVDICRLGIGGGSVCITADQTGYHRKAVTEIFECYGHLANLKEMTIDFKQKNKKLIARTKFIKQQAKNATILADGGFKHSGDIVKAFGLGANYIMSGRLFVHAQEAYMYELDSTDPLFACYYGQASIHSEFGKAKGKYIEGTHELIDTNKMIPLETIINNLWDGIRSGISYSGEKSVSDFIGNAIIEVIS